MRQAYLVFVERVSTYRVWAEDGEDPLDVYLDTDPEELCQDTMRADFQIDDEPPAQEGV